MVKIGDTVRYLNQVGGGRIIRIEGKMAWVDDDGFETPVLLSECVVVRSAEQAAATDQAIKAKDTTITTVAPKSTSQQYALSKLEETKTTDEAEKPVEIAGRDKLNIVVGFEPAERTKLSQTDFDASLINDSNYYLYFSLATRDDDTSQWVCRYAGMVEPNTELWLGTFERNEVARFDHLCLQYVAFKSHKEYDLKQSESVELAVDTTKFFRLHCYHINPYFDNEVIAFTFVKDDVAQNRQNLNLSQLNALSGRNNDTMLQDRMHRSNNRYAPKDSPKRPSKHDTAKFTEPLVIDLHIDELVDNTAGMSNSDMLNLQIDTFRQIMDENLRNYGRKIVFIHGKGEGILRQALMKELNHRYKGHDVQDASFMEYGYGATQVTIRQHPDKFTPRKR